jgi:putative component of membrane protein insertase Oxa1/YidC/SpoIIIJ protein YidD
MNISSSLFSCWITLFSFSLLAHPGYFEPWGKDAELKPPQEEKRKERTSVATQIADAIIRFHQEVISPVDGPRSHYRPTSSQYMHLAMHRYGFLKGFIMGCDRLLRENDEEWVYRTIQVDGRIFKYDPAKENKYD